MKSDDQVATGDNGTFDMKTEMLVLSGKEVVLSEGTNVLVGCKLTVEMKTGQANVEGCGGRVMMSMHRPRRRTGAPKPIMAVGTSLLSRIAGRCRQVGTPGHCARRRG